MTIQTCYSFRTIICYKVCSQCFFFELWWKPTDRHWFKCQGVWVTLKIIVPQLAIQVTFNIKHCSLTLTANTYQARTTIFQFYKIYPWRGKATHTRDNFEVQVEECILVQEGKILHTLYWWPNLVLRNKWFLVTQRSERQWWLFLSKFHSYFRFRFWSIIVFPTSVLCFLHLLWGHQISSHSGISKECGAERVEFLSFFSPFVHSSICFMFWKD